MQYQITKRFSRKITKDYQSYEFSTELSRAVEVNSAQELAEESMKVFNQARILTEKDIVESLPDSVVGEVTPKTI